MKNCVVSWVPNKIDIAQDSEKGWAVLKFGVDDDYVELMFPRSAIEPLFKQITDTLDQNDEAYRAERGEPN
jgi:hypothetical protein